MKKRTERYRQRSGQSGKMAALAIAAGVIVFGAGCGNSVMDRKQALNFALADAGLAAEEITLTKQELEKKDGKSRYEIAFTSSDYEYYYEIDASSGAVTEVSINALPSGSGQAGSGENRTGGQQGQSGDQAGSGEGQENGGAENVPEQSGSQEAGQQGQSGSQEAGQQGQSGSQETGQQGQSGSQEAGQQGQPGSQEAGQQGQSDGQVDTIDSAKAIALADAGLTEEDVTFTKEKLDWDHGVAVYDIDFYTADREYEYEINAATGAILDRSEEVFRNPGNRVTGTDSRIGEEEAKETAAAYAGFTVEEVFFTKIKLEEEHGRAEYEIEFYKDRVEYELTIDAATGAVLEYESEYDD